MMRLLRQTLKDRRGVSAVEFALMSPLLTLGALATYDAGAAVYEKMVINQALRSAAQSAIASGDSAAARDVLLSTAEDNFTVVTGGIGTETTLAVDIAEYCICPSAPAVQVDCASTCPAPDSVQRLFAITADKDYVGILLPTIELSGEIDVMLP